jgi:hypothetical protein
MKTNSARPVPGPDGRKTLDRCWGNGGGSGGAAHIPRQGAVDGLQAIENRRVKDS